MNEDIIKMYRQLSKLGEHFPGSDVILVEGKYIDVLFPCRYLSR